MEIPATGGGQARWHSTTAHRLHHRCGFALRHARKEAGGTRQWSGVRDISQRFREWLTALDKELADPVGKAMRCTSTDSMNESGKTEVEGKPTKRNVRTLNIFDQLPCDAPSTGMGTTQEAYGRHTEDNFANSSTFLRGKPGDGEDSDAYQQGGLADKESTSLRGQSWESKKDENVRDTSVHSDAASTCEGEHLDLASARAPRRRPNRRSRKRARHLEQAEIIGVLAQEAASAGDSPQQQFARRAGFLATCIEEDLDARMLWEPLKNSGAVSSGSEDSSRAMAPSSDDYGLPQQQEKEQQEQQDQTREEEENVALPCPDCLHPQQPTWEQQQQCNQNQEKEEAALTIDDYGLAQQPEQEQQQQCVQQKEEEEEQPTQEQQQQCVQEAAGLSAAALDATNEVALSTFSNKGGVILPASVSRDLFDTRCTQKVKSAQQDGTQPEARLMLKHSCQSWGCTASGMVVASKGNHQMTSGHFEREPPASSHNEQPTCHAAAAAAAAAATEIPDPEQEFAQRIWHSECSLPQQHESAASAGPLQKTAERFDAAGFDQESTARERLEVDSWDHQQLQQAIQARLENSRARTVGTSLGQLEAHQEGGDWSSEEWETTTLGKHCVDVLRQCEASLCSGVPCWLSDIQDGRAEWMRYQGNLGTCSAILENLLRDTEDYDMDDDLLERLQGLCDPEGDISFPNLEGRLQEIIDDMEALTGENEDDCDQMEMRILRSQAEEFEQKDTQLRAALRTAAESAEALLH